MTVSLEPQVRICSPDIISEDADQITAVYVDNQVRVKRNGGDIRVERQSPKPWLIRTDKRKPGKLGLMLVGLGGNNGSTLAAGLLANKMGLTWESRRGVEKANFLGSLVMSSTVSLGFDEEAGEEVFIPMSEMVSFVRPEDIVLGGWDINSMSVGDALKRSRVLEPDLIRQVKPELDKLVPLPSIYHPDFIAMNQADRANNTIKGTKSEQLQRIREDIREFKALHALEKMVVMWTANTERFTKLQEGLHYRAADLIAGIERNEAEISPSTMFAVAAIMEGCPYINGSPQNTFVPGLVDLALERNVPIAGDDFKSGQTKVKSVLVDFLIGSGIKPVSIVSYNHLGNNDGKNLAEAAQFASKEKSKRGVVEDMVASNRLMYPKHDDGPDHKVIIEYVPAVGDSKRALDEYESEIFLGGRHTLSMHQVCEDSLLAAPLMLDLVLLIEFFSRVSVAPAGDGGPFVGLHPVMSLLAFCLKAPLFPQGWPVVNALGRQRRAIEILLRASIGLPPIDELHLTARL